MFAPRIQNKEFTPSGADVERPVFTPVRVSADNHVNIVVEDVAQRPFVHAERRRTLALQCTFAVTSQTVRQVVCQRRRQGEEEGPERS